MAVDARGRKVRRYSGEGSLGLSAILVVFSLAIICLSFYLFVYFDSWLFLAGILVYGLSLGIPTLFMSGKTASHSAGGLETTLDAPPAAPTNISRASAH